MTKSPKSGYLWHFSQSWDRRNTSSIIPKQDKKRSISSMNKLAEIVELCGRDS